MGINLCVHEDRTSDGRSTRHKQPAKKTEQRSNDVKYELNGARTSAVQLTRRKDGCQEQIGRIVRRPQRLQAGIDRARGQLFQMWQVELVVYLNFAFGTLEFMTTGNPSRLSHCVSESVPHSTDVLFVLVQAVDGLRKPPTNHY